MKRINGEIIRGSIRFSKLINWSGDCLDGSLTTRDANSYIINFNWFIMCIFLVIPKRYDALLLDILADCSRGSLKIPRNSEVKKWMRIEPHSLSMARKIVGSRIGRLEGARTEIPFRSKNQYTWLRNGLWKYAPSDPNRQHQQQNVSGRHNQFQNTKNPQRTF